MPFDPAKQDHFGFNILYNANDGRERRGWLHWTPGIGEEKLAFMFRNVRLVPAGTGKSEPDDFDGPQPVFKRRSGYNQRLSADRYEDFPFGTTRYSRRRKSHSHRKEKRSAEPGGTELRFRYETGRLRGHGSMPGSPLHGKGKQSNFLQKS